MAGKIGFAADNNIVADFQKIRDAPLLKCQCVRKVISKYFPES
jgi:hypothetical protein